MPSPGGKVLAFLTDLTLWTCNPSSYNLKMASTSTARSAKLIEQEAEVSVPWNRSVSAERSRQVDRILRAFKLK